MNGWQLSRRARSDLAEIWRYSYAHWGLDQADRYVGEIYKAFGKLAANPSLGRRFARKPKATGQRPKEIRKYRCGAHLIFHRRQRKQVYIVRILHESMHHDRHLR
jgi:toxin ParE1/3/4